MYFLSRHNRLYAVFAPIRPVYRYCITMLVLTLVVYGWFTWIYSPLNASIHSCMQKCSKLEQDQQAAQQIAPSSARLEKIVHDMANSLSSKNKPEYNQVLPTLLNSIQQAHLKLIACTIEKDIQKEWYILQQIAIDCNGSLKNSVQLFTLIAQQTLPLSVEQVTLTTANNQNYNLHLMLSLVTVP